MYFTSWPFLTYSYQVLLIFIYYHSTNFPILVTIWNVLKPIVESIFIDLFPPDCQLQKRSDCKALNLNSVFIAVMIGGEYYFCEVR